MGNLFRNLFNLKTVTTEFPFQEKMSIITAIQSQYQISQRSSLISTQKKRPSYEGLNIFTKK